MHKKAYFYSVRFRLLILSLLFVAYGTIVSHEVVFGHHLSPDKVCHHHDYGNTDHHDEGCDDLPCLMDINPHFVSSSPDLKVAVNDSDIPDHASSFVAELTNYVFFREVVPFLTDRLKVSLSQSPVLRSGSLRGPPLV